jgi:molecular chaperone DnaK (HSP70)
MKRVLRKLQAPKTGGDSPIEGAVLTVPASFELDQRRHLCQAALLAELLVIELVEEPIAIAVHYGSHQAPDGENHLVLDLGGAGARATVLRVDPAWPRIVGHASDPGLAGGHFDEAVAGLLAEAFRQAHGFDPRDDPADRPALRHDAERVKVELARCEDPLVRTAILVADRIVDAVVTRGQLDEITAPLLDRARPLCEAALHGASLDWRDLSLILLAGGSANLPGVVPSLAQWSGLPPDRIRRQQPELAVAYGAALIAAGRAGPVGGPTRKVAEADLGFLVIDPATNGPAVDVVIPRGTPIPARRGTIYYSNRADQRRMFFDVIQAAGPGSSPVSLGRFAFPLDRPGKNRALEVTLGYDAVGFPFVEARDSETGRRVRRDVSGVPGSRPDPEENPGQSIDRIQLLE